LGEAYVVAAIDCGIAGIANAKFALQAAQNHIINLKPLERFAKQRVFKCAGGVLFDNGLTSNAPR
jgi:hypothetical protein